MNRYINNPYYTITILLTKKYKNFNNRDAMDYDMTINHIFNGEVQSENGTCEYMTINNFKKWYFNNHKVKNLKIFRIGRIKKTG